MIHVELRSELSSTGQSVASNERPRLQAAQNTAAKCLDDFLQAIDQCNEPKRLVGSAVKRSPRTRFWTGRLPLASVCEGPLTTD